MSRDTFAESKPFHWFGPTTVQKLFEQLGQTNRNARLEVHTHGDKLWLRVVPDDGQPLEPLNDSFLCPPIC